jgi:hypothetical protein
MYGVKGALADVYDVSEDFISNKFINEHLSEIEKIATGDEKAIEGLRDSLSQDLVANILVHNGLEEEKQSELLDSFVNLRERLQYIMNSDPLLLGDNVEISQDFTDQLNRLIEDSQMTVEEANQMFSALGVEPTYATDEVEQVQKVPKTTTVHKVTNIGHAPVQVGNDND